MSYSNYNGYNIQELYLSGSLFKNHPCFGTFRNNMQLGIKDGYLHFKGPNHIEMGGILDNPFDPRFTCLRTTRTPLSTGNITYIQYKNEPRIEGFSMGANTIGGPSADVPCREPHCAYRFRVYGDESSPFCMYSSDGKFICMK